MPAGIALEATHPTVTNSRCRTEGCSNCTRMSPSAPSAGPTRGPQDEKAAASPTHENGNCPQTSPLSSMQPNADSPLAQGEPSELETTRQLELCADPKICESGAFLSSSLPGCAPQPVGTHCRECPAHSAHDSTPLRGQSDQCGGDSCGLQTHTRAAEHGNCSCKCQKEHAGDTWAFMKVSQGECPKHVVRQFNGDLLSLVSDIDEMMSCSGKARAEPSDTTVSDSSTTCCSY